MNRFLIAPLLAACLFGSTGCVHRELVSFADHHSKPLTGVQAGVLRNYLFWASYEHIFYSCSEEGDKLTCKRVCGGSSDLVCPEAVGSQGAVGTNIE
jgi:hypothetical protein